MRIFALMSEKSDIEIAIICQWDNQATSCCTINIIVPW